MLCRLLFGHAVAFSVATCAAAEPGATIDLTASPRAGATTQVRVHYEAGGDLTLPSREGDQEVPLSVVADLAYHERWLEPTANAADQAQRRQTLRHYDTAQATIKIDKGGLDVSLPANRRLILAAADRAATLLASPSGPLLREQLDLIDVPAGTHVLDRLVPGGTRKVGDKWKHDAETAQVLLGIEEVTVCELESVLIGIDRGYAQIRLAGTVHGKTDGAAAELEIKAGYLFESRTGRVTRLNLAFAEQRKAGPIGPAVDVIGKLTLEVDSVTEPDELADQKQAPLSTAELDRLALLVLEEESSGVRLLHDRRWHVTSQERERIVLRRLDGGQLIAQCNLTIRPERQAGRQPTLAEFEKDVRFSLGNRLESLVTTGEWTNDAGLRCHRVVAQGKVDDLPMQWHYYLASPPAGRSVAFAFSVEPQFVEQLGDADRALVESVRLSPSGEGGLPATESAAARPRSRRAQ